MTLTAKGLTPLTRTEAPESLLSATTITIGADTDSNGSGTIDLQTRTLTRLQITNAGNVYVASKIGINKTVPISALHIDATYAIDTTATEFPIRLRPPSGLGDFLFMLNTTMFGAQNDDVVWWGWNIDGSAPTEPSIHFAMEREFGTDYEIHMETHRPHGSNVIRHWTWNINRTTGETSHTIRADSFSVVNATAGTHLVEVNASEILLNQETRVRLRTDVVDFETVDNAGAPAKQIHIAPYPSDSELSWLVFGDPGAGGGVSLAQVSGKLQLFSAGSTLSNGGLKLGSVTFPTGVAQTIPYPGGLEVVQIGAGFASLAEVSPVSLFGTSSYMILSDLSNTLVNAPTGGSVFFRINNVTKASVDTNGVNTPGVYKVSGTQVLGAQGAAVADATDAASAITQLNALLARCRAQGFIAT